MTHPNTIHDQDLIAETFLRIGTIQGTAKELGIARQTIQHAIKRLGLKPPVASGSKGALQHAEFEPPKKGVARYILTSAQNNTKVHPQVWKNLMALAKHYKADVLVSRFVYNKHSMAGKANKPGYVADGATDEYGDLWYDPKITPYLSDERIEIAPNLMWCGEMNIIPTAARPLSGLESYTGRRSGIFPHVKIAMESVASGKFEDTKFNYTTGTVTQLNYIHRKAGLKAEFHHCYGALLVEVDSKGHWWVRQLNADDRGVIYDLNIRAAAGKVTKGHSVEAINWGDIHEAEIDPIVKKVCFAKGGMLDKLKPKHQFMHDLFSMLRRNHHDAKNAHRMFEIHAKGLDKVEEEVRDSATFLAETSRPWCKTVVVDSNHDNALEKWLREADYKKDPPNAVFFLQCQLRKYESLARHDEDYHLLEDVLTDYAEIDHVEFLRPDESYLIAGGIECGMHGHLGINGSRGTPQGFTKMGRKANTGHTHSAGIRDGVFTSGHCSVKDMGYNVGPGSWSQSHIVTYASGKRAIITQYAGKWCADMQGS